MVLFWNHLSKDNFFKLRISSRFVDYGNRYLFLAKCGYFSRKCLIDMLQKTIITFYLTKHENCM